MSRRGHITSQSYIDWLKSMGCVFYAPLTEGDTRDYISGQNLVVSSGTVTWDNNQNAYKFYGPYSTQSFVANWSGLNMNIDINNVELSILHESYVWNVSVCPVVFGNRTLAFNCEAAPTYQWFKWAVSWEKYDGVNHKYSWLYINGNPNPNFPNGQDRGTGYTKFPTAAIQSVESNPSGSLSHYRNRTYYMRNAMIFNVALTQAQIKEIQQIP